MDISRKEQLVIEKSWRRNIVPWNSGNVYSPWSKYDSASSTSIWWCCKRCTADHWIRNALGTINTLYDFLEASVKWHSKFEIVQKVLNGAKPPITLKHLYETRLTSHYRAVHAIKELFEAVTKVLQELKEEEGKTGADAALLLKSIYISTFSERKRNWDPDGLEPGSSKLWSDALTTELLELWHWSRDRHNSIPDGSQVSVGFYSVGSLCRFLSTEVLMLYSCCLLSVYILSVNISFLHQHFSSQLCARILSFEWLIYSLTTYDYILTS